MEKKGSKLPRHVTARATALFRPFRPYKLVIAICFALCVLVGTHIYVYATLTQLKIAQQNGITIQMQKQAAVLAEQSAEKVRLERERIEKEQKAAEEAAAKELAEQARVNPNNPAVLSSTACNTAKMHNNPASIDVLINKKHCVLPLNYVPSDLVTSNGATLSAQVIDAFNQMYAAAMAAGQPFSVTSSFRSYDSQIATYNKWVSISGYDGADEYSARPGYSEHQTGLVLDVAAGGCKLDCFGSTSQYTWFQQHAAEYGFIQRYYAGYEDITGYTSEEWHYRYVGVAVAKDMQAKGVKTLEQYWQMEGGDYY